MHRPTRIVLSFLLALFGIVQSAHATVRIAVDINRQTMTVTAGSGASYVWPVSTGRAGFDTPRGTYGVQGMMAVAYSNLYHNAPMPHSIFFSGAYAIHGTYATGMLGRAASHGCVRLAPGNAATLFSLVRTEGAVISITGAAPRIYTASRMKRVKATRLAGHITKHHKATRLAKLHRAPSTGYLAYAAPQAQDVPLHSWLQDPGGGY